MQTPSTPDTFPQYAANVKRLNNEIRDQQTGAFRLKKIGLYTNIYVQWISGDSEITARKLAQSLANHDSAIGKTLRALESDGLIRRECARASDRQGTQMLIVPVFEK